MMLDQAFIATLPHDPEAAWPLYEAHAREKCQDSGYNGETFLDRQKYVCLLIAFAQLYDIGIEIEDPTTMSARQFDEYYARAERQITIFTAKMALKTAKRIGLYSLGPAIKTEIHHYISQIREILNNVELRANKKEALLDKLNEFAKEVDKDRTRGEIWASIYVAVKAEVKDGVTALEPIIKPLERIADALGKGKEVLDMLLPAPKEKLKIEGPKNKIPADNLEDEIPF